MSGITRAEALRRIDDTTQKLKDQIMSYAEMAGMTEEERDEAVHACATIFRIDRRAGLRIIGSSLGMHRAPSWDTSRVKR